MSNSAIDLKKMGGLWLGAARQWIQSHFMNGSRVTWGSDDVLGRKLTVSEIEDLAAHVAEAAYKEMPKTYAIFKHGLEECDGEIGVALLTDRYKANLIFTNWTEQAKRSGQGRVEVWEYDPISDMRKRIFSSVDGEETNPC